MFLTFLRKNAVMCIAIAVAMVSVVIVPPDREYLGYFDFKTLTCLFCTLAVVCAFKNIHFFQIVASHIVSIFKTTRTAVIALVYITFIGSMLIANDMALITFLPLGYYVLSSTGNQKYMAFTFIMQNIAANLGGMLTPFGNPQNLYLYSYYNIGDAEFVKIMFPPFVLSVILITLACFTIKKDELKIVYDNGEKLDVKKTVVYTILFALSIAIVFRIFPYYIGLIVIPLFILLFDRKALKDVDYPLLFTFCAFFVFSGNMSRIPLVNELLGNLIRRNTLLYGMLSCQAISNVPSAILLSRFTENYPQLLVAVNIGGAGTLIASLASLITFKEYIKIEPGNVKTYLKKFSFYNFSILLILFVFMTILFY